MRLRRSGEWFDIEPADILPVLMRAGRDGFVAKNADAFQIVGYDRDAVPEYLGVWEWGDLEIDECCPFCGSRHEYNVACMKHVQFLCQRNAIRACPKANIYNRRIRPFA